MKKVVALLAVIGLFGCTQQTVEKKASVAGPARSDVVSNEFLFIGPEDRVRSALAEMNIKATIVPIVAGESFQVKYSGSVSFEEIESKVAPLVEVIEPHYRVKAFSSLNRREWPTDRLFFKQWGLNNVGQSAPFGLPGDRGADMSVLEAWKVTQGSKDVVVAVIDEGIDYLHPDLRDNMWVNEKESPAKGGIAGQDDDGNGYYDDVYGYDFVSGGTTALYYGQPGTPDPMDKGGHGTHCAGGIGAVASNDVGVAGVAPKVRLMALRALGDAGGDIADLSRAVEYAVANKADIISASWGGGGRSAIMQRALRRAEREGVLFVAAAGNDGANADVKPMFPAGYDRDDRGREFTNIVSVGASDNKDTPADFSNYGHGRVHVFAPGVNILSTYPRDLTEAGRQPYVVMSGTSMAAPYVSGIAALMIAQNPSYKRNPALVKEMLIASCDEKPALVGRAACNGRVNAHKAVTADPTRGTLNQQWQTIAHSHSQRQFNRELVDIRHKIEVPNARYIRAHFDFVDIKEPYDSIYIYDENFRFIGRVEQTDADDLWSPTVPGSVMYVRFVNSLVRRTEGMMLQGQQSEITCSQRGATEITREQSGTFACRVDAMESSAGSSKEFNTFNSEGYSIDQVAFVPGPTATENR